MTKSWNSDAFAMAPSNIRVGCQRLQACVAVSRTDRFPELVEATLSAHLDQEEFVFEIAPGLKMSIGREADDADPDFWMNAAFRAIAAARVAPLVISTAGLFARRLRRLISDAQARGLPVRMHRLDVEEYGHWLDGEDVRFLAGFETLATDLRQKIVWLTVDSLSDLERQFENHMGELSDRRKKLIELGREGADGTIDALSVQVLLGEPSPEMTLRSLKDELRLELTTGHALFWNEGHVWSFDSGDPGCLRWCRDIITIEGRRLSETASGAALGKPVTAVVQHPLLTDEMIVGSISHAIEGGQVSASIELELPRYHFDFITGRYW